MPFDQIVRNNVCNNTGHRITNFTLESVEKNTAVRFSSEFFCMACGVSLDEIRTPPKVKRPRKAKEEVPAETQQ